MSTKPTTPALLGFLTLLLLSTPAQAILDRNANGMSDIWEQYWGVPPTAAAEDPDLDGFINLQESRLGTNPWAYDSAMRLWLEPRSAQNQIAIFVETVVGKRYQVETSTTLQNWFNLGPPFTGDGTILGLLATMPASGQAAYFRYRYLSETDTDGDGLTAWEEAQLGTSDLLTDTDGDGLPDAWEAAFGLDPLDSADASENLDGDPFTNLDEFWAGLDPRDPTNGISGVQQPPNAPGKPLVLQEREATEATIIWSDNSDDELLFFIERSHGGGVWQRVGATPANATSFTDSPIEPSVVYFYRIDARNNAPE